ncbi:HIRAN domain-containing protein [Paenarthrobacter aromaticivorans]|uniref:HIRAN domain-containing protein n=1 Tax=Paenarthrobacter aromaticivorans TaxID=2849150 RepID=UPI003A811BED
MSSTSRRRRSSESSPGRSPQPSGGASVRQAISDETWRVLLAADSTAPASKFQRDFVRASVGRATGKRPSLKHLTVGQAAQVLVHLGQDPTKLTSGGRGVPVVEKAGVIAKWVLFGLILLVVTLSSPAGFVLTLGIVGFVLLSRKRRRTRQAWEDEHWSIKPLDAPHESTSPHGLVDPVAAQDTVPGQWVPSQTDVSVGTPTSGLKKTYAVSLGRPEWPNVEIVGEHAYGQAIRAALRGGGAQVGVGRDVEVENLAVELVAEPDNPYDSNAISVRWDSKVLGYLSREDAVRFAQPVRRIIASGLVAEASARVWAYDDGSQLRARVTIALPEPELIAPLNAPPTGVTSLVPWGTAMQVLKEENHFDVLVNHVPPTGTGLLLVSLHKQTRTLKNGNERSFVEVRIDGERVGELSNVTSAHLLPILEHTEAVDETAVAYAKITGSALAAQLVLHAAKAIDISNDWLASGPHPAPVLLPWAANYEVSPAYRN